MLEPLTLALSPRGRGGMLEPLTLALCLIGDVPP
jgi:hypothetical protein